MFKKPRRRVTRVFLHCSAASRPSINAAEIKRWHKKRGWSDIGYHYFIKTNGILEKGRLIDRVPAAQRGHNAGTIAICLNGLWKKDFTEKQFETLRALCKEINDAYNGNVTFHGHREVSAKECPVFDYKKVLKLDRKGRLNKRWGGLI